MNATPRQRDLIARLMDGWVPDWSRSTVKSGSVVIDYLLTLPVIGHAAHPELNRFGNPLHESPCVCGTYDRCSGVRDENAANSGNWRDRFRAYND